MPPKLIELKKKKEKDYSDSSVDDWWWEQDWGQVWNIYLHSLLLSPPPLSVTLKHTGLELQAFNYFLLWSRVAIIYVSS